MKPHIKAPAAGIFFLAIGLLAWVFLTPSGHLLYFLPLFIFYITIVINTFFSIRLFVKITPQENIGQKICDTVLVILYVLLALSMGHILVFIFFDTLLFVVAAVKYTFLSQIAPYPVLLRRKILVDLSGILLGLLTLAGIAAGYELASIWAFALIFVLANILLFFVWPLYHLRHDA